MRVNDLIKVAIVAIVLSLLINLYVAYNIKYNLERYPNASPKTALFDGFGYLRVFINLIMVMFVQEYLAYEIRSGYTALLMKTGIGLRRYVFERIMFFTIIALLLAIPTYFIVSPIARYSDVLFCCILGDLLTITMYSFIISFIFPNAIPVIFGGLLLTYLTRIYLSIFLYNVSHELLVLYIFNPIMIWFIEDNLFVEKHILYLFTLLYVILVLVIEYFSTMKIVSKRGIYK